MPIDTPLPSRVRRTLVIFRLNYAELWRLADHHPFRFALLLRVKWTLSERFDRTDTSSFRPPLVENPVLPIGLRDGFAGVRSEFEALGFRCLGVCQEALAGAQACMAYFVRGPIAAVHVLSRRHSYSTLMSFPPDRQRMTTATGRGAIETGSLHDRLLLSRRTPLGALVERHEARIAALNLPPLTEETALDEVERLAREAHVLHVARGVFVEEPLVETPSPAAPAAVPPPLPTGPRT